MLAEGTSHLIQLGGGGPEGQVNFASPVGNMIGRKTCAQGITTVVIWLGGGSLGIGKQCEPRGGGVLRNFFTGMCRPC